MSVILANPVMIDAYRTGNPGNGKPFPDGSKIAKIHWNTKKSAEAPLPRWCRAPCMTLISSRRIARDSRTPADGDTPSLTMTPRRYAHARGQRRQVRVRVPYGSGGKKIIFSRRTRRGEQRESLVMSAFASPASNRQAGKRRRGLRCARSFPANRPLDARRRRFLSRRRLRPHALAVLLDCPSLTQGVLLRNPQSDESRSDMRRLTLLSAFVVAEHLDPPGFTSPVSLTTVKTRKSFATAMVANIIFFSGYALLRWNFQDAGALARTPIHAPELGVAASAKHPTRPGQIRTRKHAHDASHRRIQGRLRAGAARRRADGKQPPTRLLPWSFMLKADGPGPCPAMGQSIAVTAGLFRHGRSGGTSF
jgi:hypothetical protein